MIRVFNNQAFGQIRTIDIDSEPYFVGKDVAEVLGYANSRDAISKHVDVEDKTTTLIQGTGSNYTSNAVVINESGLYSLILRSQFPTAKAFKRWVTSEVLPTIRKTGGVYATKEGIEKLIADPATTIKPLETIQTERKEKEALKQQVIQKEAVLRRQAPKVEYTDRVLQSESLTPTTVIAKELGYSARKLNELLHDRKVIFNQSGTWVLYSKYQGLGFT